MINTLLLGYLPMRFMRASRREGLGTAVGQVLRARAEAYRRAGGHGAVAHYMHDGLQLARLFRRQGLTTDLVDGTRLATCRMYDNPRALWRGFLKNATEGMAKPVALPIWTVLLAGGHLLPWLTLAIVTGRRPAWKRTRRGGASCSGGPSSRARGPGGEVRRAVVHHAALPARGRAHPGAAVAGAARLPRRSAGRLARTRLRAPDLRLAQTRFRATSWRAMMMRCISLVPSPMHISGASR